jgi:hypothetical protein
LPCSIICSLLKSSKRSGGSSPAYDFADPLPRRLAPAWRKFAKIGLPLRFTLDVSFYPWVRKCVSAGKAFQEGGSKSVLIAFAVSIIISLY